MHTHLEFDLHTRANPEQIKELLTDFSPPPRRSVAPALAEVVRGVFGRGDRG